MLDWWVEQPPFLRTTLAFIPLAIGGVCFFFGMWLVGIELTALGVVLFAVSFPRRSEMKGFHD